MELYVKFILFPYFLLFFWFLDIILSDALILPISQLRTQQVITSQIQTIYIFLCSFCNRNWWKISP